MDFFCSAPWAGARTTPFDFRRITGLRIGGAHRVGLGIVFEEHDLCHHRVLGQGMKCGHGQPPCNPTRNPTSNLAISCTKKVNPFSLIIVDMRVDLVCTRDREFGSGVASWIAGGLAMSAFHALPQDPVVAKVMSFEHNPKPRPMCTHPTCQKKAGYTPVPALAPSCRVGVPCSCDACNSGSSSGVHISQNRRGEVSHAFVGGRGHGRCLRGRLRDETSHHAVPSFLLTFAP